MKKIQKNLNVKLDSKLKNDFQKQCKKEGCFIAGKVQVLLTEYLEKTKELAV